MVMETPRTLKTTQAIATAGFCPLELLLLKIPYTLAVGLRKINFKLTRKFLFSWLAFIVP